MNSEIKFPVSFEAVQSSIDAIKNALKGIKPDSSLYKTLSSSLTKIEGQAEQLRAILSNPIKDKSAISSAFKKYSDLVTATKVQAGKLQSVGFNDLVIPQEAADRLDELITRTNTLKQQIKGINDTKLRELKENLKADTSKQELVSKLNLDDVKSFKGLDMQLKKQENNIRTEINSIEKEISESQIAEKLRQELEDAAHFTEDGVNAIRFKKNKKDNFLSAIEQQLGIKVDNAKSAQAELEKRIASPEQNAALVQKRDLLTEQQRQLESIRDLEKTQFNPDLGTEQLKQQLDEAQAEIKELQSALVELARERGIDLSNTIGKDLNQGLRDAERNATEASSAFDRLNETTQKLHHIKSLATQFVSWGTAIRWSVREIKNMISSIESLDKVITSIAVVTNMTQDQLWNQMNSYTEIAQRYGTSIEGAYQVSQIFYQQGLQTNEVMELTVETLKMAKIAGLDYAEAADYEFCHVA